MATKTWNGSVGAFAADGNWTPQAVPVSGDVAIITAGVVTATGMLPGFLVIALSSSSSASPMLNLSDATLVASSQLKVKASATNVILRLHGTVNNQGTISASGSTGAAVSFQIGDAQESSATTFVNTGSIQVSDTAFQIVNGSGNPGDHLENDGLIAIRSPSQTPQLAYVSSNIMGTGTVLLGSNVTFEAALAVSAGQSFVFERGNGGATTLRINAGKLFDGTISGFGLPDALQLVSGKWDSATYGPTGANSGVLALSLGGVVAKSLSFKGVVYNRQF